MESSEETKKDTERINELKRLLNDPIDKEKDFIQQLHTRHELEILRLQLEWRKQIFEFQVSKQELLLKLNEEIKHNYPREILEELSDEEIEKNILDISDVYQDDEYIYYSVADNFNKKLGPRLKGSGPYSGELFNAVLLKLLEFSKSHGKVVILNLDNTYGYTYDFLSSAFSKIHANELKSIKIISNEEPYLKDRILEIIRIHES